MDRHDIELLSTAAPSSRFVVAAFLDVRGFSAYMEQRESAEAALFLQHFFRWVIDHFDADFVKPTGDGLLLIRDYTSSDVEEQATTAISAAVELLDEFPSAFADEPMLDFAPPSSIGIGMARGHATALISGGRRLDYAGRPLNLAARLMDLARPSGVVLDASDFGPFVPPALHDRFVEGQADIRGISRSRPHRLLHTAPETALADPQRPATAPP